MQEAGIVLQCVVPAVAVEQLEVAKEEVGEVVEVELGQLLPDLLQEEVAEGGATAEIAREFLQQEAEVGQSPDLQLLLVPHQQLQAAHEIVDSVFLRPSMQFELGEQASHPVDRAGQVLLDPEGHG
jgi:hypothetical protein